MGYEALFCFAALQHLPLSVWGDVVRGVGAMAGWSLLVECYGVILKERGSVKGVGSVSWLVWALFSPERFDWVPDEVCEVMKGLVGCFKLEYQARLMKYNREKEEGDLWYSHEGSWESRDISMLPRSLNGWYLSVEHEFDFSLGAIRELARLAAIVAVLQHIQCTTTFSIPRRPHPPPLLSQHSLHPRHRHLRVPPSTTTKGQLSILKSATTTKKTTSRLPRPRPRPRPRPVRQSPLKAPKSHTPLHSPMIRVGSASHGLGLTVSPLRAVEREPGVVRRRKASGRRRKDDDDDDDVMREKGRRRRREEEREREERRKKKEREEEWRKKRRERMAERVGSVMKQWFWLRPRKKALFERVGGEYGKCLDDIALWRRCESMFQEALRLPCTPSVLSLFGIEGDVAKGVTMEVIGGFGRSLQVLDLRGCKWVDDEVVHLIIKRCQHLHILDLSGATCTPPSLQLLLTSLPNLHSLSLCAWTCLTSSSFTTALQHAPISTTLPSIPPQLDPRSAPHGTSQRLLFGAPSIPAPALRALNLTDCRNLDDDALDAIAKFAPGIQDLCLHGLLKLTDKGICTLATRNARLHRLNTAGAYKVSRDAIRFLINQIPNLILYVSPNQSLANP